MFGRTREEFLHLEEWHKKSSVWKDNITILIFGKMRYKKFDVWKDGKKIIMSGRIR